jgi:hypothetical protein
MKTTDLIAILSRLSVETRPTACYGCIYEHQHCIHGCDVLKETIAWIEAAEQGLKGMDPCGTCTYELLANDEEPCDSCKNYNRWKYCGPQ